MKIIIMVHALTGGGAERVAASWANGLSAAGHDVAIYASTKGQTYATAPGVRIIPRKTIRQGSYSFISKVLRKAFGPLKATFDLRKLIRHERPDVIINVLYLDGYPLLLGRLLSGRKVPIIMTDHNTYERPEGVKMLRTQHRNKFYDNRLYDLVTVLTRRDKEILDSHGINNVEVLHNPLFLEPVKDTPVKEKIVMACGRIDDWHCKGFDVLVEAWRQVAPNHPDWRLRIVGAGKKETKEKLHAFAGEYEASVEFVEYTSNIVEEYRRASVFVLSSRYEGWGLVMVEAMSQGCATIACDYLGRQAEAIEEGKNGLLCEPDNAVALAEKIGRLLTDDSLRHRLQQAAPASVAKFSEVDTARKLEQLISALRK